MKKLKPETSELIVPFLEHDENKEPYEVIYADPRDEEIHLQILKKAQLNAHMARWFLDLEYNHFLWSDGIYEILEVDPKTSGASYDTFIAVVHPEDRHIKDTAQNELLNTRKTIEITYRLLMNDGRIKWINEICNTDFDQNRNAIRFYGIIQDITKFKLLEEKLRQKEESYLTLIDSLPSGIAIYQNRKFTFVNLPGLRIFGASDANELIGQPVIKFAQANSIKNILKKIKGLVIGKAVSPFEEKLIRLDGTVIDVEITPIKTIFNDAPAIQVIVNDITEQKKSEQALKRSEEKYRLLAVNLSDVVWTINAEGSITYVNPFVENLLGRSVDSAIKTNLSKILTPASILASLNELQEMKSIVQSGRKMEPRSLILETICEDGTSKWIQVTNNAMYNSANSFIGFSGIAQDITQIKKAEQILNKNEKLQENELQLRELLATKDKFFSIIAHDLRSPFNSIIGFLELLQTQYDEFSDSERKEYIDLIAKNANTTLSLLENLLLWAKTQTHRMAYQPIKLKLISTINSVLETFISAINLKKITLKIFIPADLEILADSNMLATIFQNLISNAIKYSNQEGTIIIKAHTKNNYTEIVVSDNGTGMNRDTKNKLFKIEEHISIDGTNNEKGSGLGLILCKDFIEKHNWSISVESEYGKGSQFIIKIPQI